jgi:hypothetical protein
MELYLILLTKKNRSIFCHRDGKYSFHWGWEECFTANMTSAFHREQESYISQGTEKSLVTARKLDQHITGIWKIECLRELKSL